jgi:hypothetical protein
VAAALARQREMRLPVDEVDLRHVGPGVHLGAPVAVTSAGVEVAP